MDNKKIKITVFVIYVALLLYFVFFSEFLGRTVIPDEMRYNFVPFKEISRFIRYAVQVGFYSVCLNLIGNILVFIPFGIFIGIFQKDNKRIWKGILWSFNFSLAIELVQLISRVGICDIDDVILNTIGGAAGIVIYKIWYTHICKNNKKEPFGDECN